ncbi:hypothetical protein NB689_000926 [Xanthomonas sacchari]|nr:hypothetical protein [Xanthomonas sacchari]
MHACGEVAGGDRLQQGGQLAQVAVADLHHRVEVLHHQPEVVLETGRIAAGAEVAGRSSRRQALDLGIDRQQAGLGRIHRLVQHRTAAGQAARIAAQIAVGVFVEDLDRLDDGVQVLEHHGVDALAQFAVHAREVLRHAVADVLVGVQLDHQHGLAGEALQLVLHAAHRLQQAAGLVTRVGGHVVVQATVGDGLGGAGGTGQRHGEAAGDHPRQQAADQHHRQAAGDEHGAPTRHRRRRFRIGLVAAGGLQIGIAGDGVLPFLRQRRGLPHQQGQGLVRLVVHAQIHHPVVDVHGHLPGAIDVLQHGLALRTAGDGARPLARLLVACALLDDDLGEADVVFLGGRQHDVADIDGHDRTGVEHVAGRADGGDVAVDDAVQSLARLEQSQQPGDDQRRGQQDEDAERGGEPGTDVVALKECNHGMAFGGMRGAMERRGLRTPTSRRCARPHRTR